MHYRKATQTDVPILAELNHQLIRDEGHRNPMTLAQLEQRMRHWLETEYEAILFEQDAHILAYALYKIENDYIYLRQFFVSRDQRRQGLGRQALKLLLSEIWPAHLPVRLEVLVGNETARRFWQAVGFSDYALTMEIDRKN